jgi:hypothetical protein
MRHISVKFKLPSTRAELAALQQMIRDEAEWIDPFSPYYYVPIDDLRLLRGFSEAELDNGKPFAGFRGQLGLIEHPFPTIIEGIGEVVFVSEEELITAGYLDAAKVATQPSPKSIAPVRQHFTDL